MRGSLVRYHVTQLRSAAEAEAEAGTTKKSVAAPPETYTVAMSESGRIVQRIAGMSRVSSGSLFHAAGSLPITAPEVIAGLIQRHQRDVDAANKATATTHAEAEKLAAGIDAAACPPAF